MAMKRLRKELEKINEFGASGANVHSVEPKGDDIFQWDVTLGGPKSSPYSGGKFHLDLSFPPRYPFEAPQVMFKTTIYHPSISRDTGKMCAEIIQDGWKPSKDAGWVLSVVSEVMANPSSTSPLEPDIAAEYERNPSGFHKKAKQWTKTYASK